MQSLISFLHYILEILSTFALRLLVRLHACSSSISVLIITVAFFLSFSSRFISFFLFLFMASGCEKDIQDSDETVSYTVILVGFQIEAILYLGLHSHHSLVFYYPDNRLHRREKKK